MNPLHEHWPIVESVCLWKFVCHILSQVPETQDSKACTRHTVRREMFSKKIFHHDEDALFFPA